MLKKKRFIISYSIFFFSFVPPKPFLSLFFWRGRRHDCYCFSAWVQLPDKIPVSPGIFKAVLLTKYFCHWRHTKPQKQATRTSLDQSVILDYVRKHFKSSPTLLTHKIALISWQHHLHVLGFVWAKSNYIGLPVTLLKKHECKQVSKDQEATFCDFGLQCPLLWFVRSEAGPRYFIPPQSEMS